MTRLGGILACVLLFIGTLGWAAPGSSYQPAATPPPAAEGWPPAGPGQGTVARDGWILYPSVLDHPGILETYDSVSTISLQGVRTADGCAFSGTVSSDDLGAATGGPVYISEVGYNPDSCRSSLVAAEVTPEQVVSIAELTGATVSSPAFTGTQRYNEVTQPVANPSLFGVAPGPVLTYSKTLTAMIKDPIGLVTTSTVTTLTWSATATAVTEVSTKHGYSWLSATGWVRDNAWVETAGYAIDGHAFGDTAESYSNSKFCSVVHFICPPLTNFLGGSGTTYAVHSRTRVEGGPGGTWVVTWTMKKSGGCNRLLSYDVVVT